MHTQSRGCSHEISKPSSALALISLALAARSMDEPRLSSPPPSDPLASAQPVPVYTQPPPLSHRADRREDAVVIATGQPATRGFCGDGCFR